MLERPVGQCGQQQLRFGQVLENVEEQERSYVVDLVESGPQLLQFGEVEGSSRNALRLRQTGSDS